MNIKFPFPVLYNYKLATLRTARIKEGVIEANSPADALEKIKKTSGLKVVSLELDIGASIKKTWRGPLLPDKVVLSFFTDMHRFLKSGLNINEVCDTISDTTANKKIKRAAVEIKDNLAKGTSLSEGIRRTKLFPELAIGTLRAGEKSGTLVKVTGFLEDFYKRKVEFSAQVGKAVAYPKLVGGVVLAAVYFIAAFILPQFQKAFASTGVQLPWITQFVFSAGASFVRWGWLILLILAFIVLWIKGLMTQDRGEKISGYFYTLPIIGGLIKDISFAVVFINFSVIHNAGIPIGEGLDILSRSIPYPHIAKRLSYAKQNIERGESLSEAFSKDKFFPSYIANMIKKGESSHGELGRCFLDLGEFYSAKVSETLDLLQKIIEPVLLMAVSTIIAIVYLAVIMVVYPGLNSIAGKGM